MGGSILFARMLHDSVMQTVGPVKLTGSMRITMPNFVMPNLVKFGATVAQIWRFNGFQDGSLPSSWSFKNSKF